MGGALSREGIIAYEHTSHSFNKKKWTSYRLMADSPQMTWIGLIMEKNQLQIINFEMHNISGFSCWMNERYTHIL